jgi:hypothetical protein
MAGGIAELSKLMYGQSLGVNLDMTDGDMNIEAMKRAAITAAATSGSTCPIFNAAAKQFKNLFAKKIYGFCSLQNEVGTLPSKIKKDFVAAYKVRFK